MEKEIGMARKLKCWVERKQKRQRMWANNSRRESVVVTDISPLLQKSENYQVIVIKNRKGRLIGWKGSKNKSVSKAKAYMRRHDRC